MSGSFAGGHGHESAPYRIENWNHLDNVRTELDAYFQLDADLDSGTEGYNDHASSSANGGDGWETIGDSDNEFGGVFDGNGHEIRDINISRPTENRVGLFDTTSAAEVFDLGVVDANIVGSETVGILAGRFSGGDVSDVYTTGEVEGDDVVGGLIGITVGSSSIDDSYSIVSVAGQDIVGGLIGQSTGTFNSLYAIGTVNGNEMVGGMFGRAVGGASECFANVSVTGIEEVGGFAGNSITNISDSYALGDVEGTDEVGGFAGTTGGRGGTYDCYSVGQVSGDTDVGGFIGSASTTVSNSYWDTESSGQSSSDAGIGLTTVEMRGDSATVNMGGLDFTDTWETVEYTDDEFSEDGYPILLTHGRQTQFEEQLPNAIFGTAAQGLPTSAVTQTLTVGTETLTGSLGLIAQAMSLPASIAGTGISTISISSGSLTEGMASPSIVTATPIALSPSLPAETETKPQIPDIHSVTSGPAHPTDFVSSHPYVSPAGLSQSFSQALTAGSDGVPSTVTGHTGTGSYAETAQFGVVVSGAESVTESVVNADTSSTVAMPISAILLAHARRTRVGNSSNKVRILYGEPNSVQLSQSPNSYR